MQTANLTASFVSRLTTALSGQYIVRDNLRPNFLTVAGIMSQSYTVQVSVDHPSGKRTSKRKAIGRFSEVPHAWRGHSQDCRSPIFERSK